jgi:SsrA-binding protein
MNAMFLVENKKARFNYEILETLEAGIELFGFEVKALRQKKASLEGSRVIVRGGEAYLIGATVSPYQPANTPQTYAADRNRKLLLTKKEINSLVGYENKKGLTIIPLSVYNKGRKIKISIGIARGKKKFDKREVIKKRETERDIGRTLKYK